MLHEKTREEGLLPLLERWGNDPVFKDFVKGTTQYPGEESEKYLEIRKLEDKNGGVSLHHKVPYNPSQSHDYDTLNYTINP